MAPRLTTVRPAPRTPEKASPAPEEAVVEVSFVLPCLNEAQTLGACIEKARRAISDNGLSAEIVVADNGSTDGSAEVAHRLGARVVNVPEPGYGSALRGGVDAARGRYIVMGDADDSYDFSTVGPFVERLRQGDELVIGNRFQGGIEPGAMPWTHRWIGNPVLTAVGRLFFHAPVGDFHCGLRAFTREAFDRLDLQTTGMEFASEIIVKASLLRLRIGEVPTVLYPDGRTRPPHLRRWRDGWRHLRFMLLLSPLWLFLVPGGLLTLSGLAMTVWLLGGARHVGPLALDIHALLLADFGCIIGYQLVVFGAFTKAFAVREGLHAAPSFLPRLLKHVNLETGVAAGLVMLVAGTAAVLAAWIGWQAAGFTRLDPRVTMRQLVPGASLLALGTETVFASFFLGVLGIPSRRTPRRPRGASSM
jgi:hypothetical protein